MTSNRMTPGHIARADRRIEIAGRHRARSTRPNHNLAQLSAFGVHPAVSAAAEILSELDRQSDAIEASGTYEADIAQARAEANAAPDGCTRTRAKHREHVLGIAATADLMERKASLRCAAARELIALAAFWRGSPAEWTALIGIARQQRLWAVADLRQAAHHSRWLAQQVIAELAAP